MCPWHGFRFELATGNCVNARLKVASFAVRVEGDEVLVDL